MSKTISLVAYCDPGHGWVKVHKSKLRELGIENDITPYSYMRDDYAYLEEDQDTSTLVDALKSHGYEWKIKSHHTNRQSKIRNYWTYST